MIFSTLVLYGLAARDLAEEKGQLLALTPFIELSRPAEFYDSLSHLQDFKTVLRDGRTSFDLPGAGAIFSALSGDLAAISISRTREGAPTALSDLALMQKARAIANALGPIHKTRFEFAVLRDRSWSGRRAAFVGVYPYWGSKRLSQSVEMYFGEADGQFCAMYVDERFDPRPQGSKPTISIEQARAFAADAYARYKPYPSARWHGQPELLLGRPIAHKRMPRYVGAHELSSEQSNCLSSRVALPFYEFMIAPTSTSIENPRSFQVISIDARDGRAMIIEEIMMRGNSNDTNSKLPALGAQVKVEVGAAKGVVRAIGQSVPKGNAVVVRGEKTIWHARFDSKNNVLYLPEGSAWKSYRPDPKVKDALNIQSKRKLLPFGTKP